MSSKVQRQQLIAKIVSSQTVTSQPQLRELLKKKGIKATVINANRKALRFTDCDDCMPLLDALLS